MKKSISIALLSLFAVTSSVSAVAQPAASVERVSQNVSKENKLGGESGLLIALLAAAAVVAGIVIISGDDDPASPQ